MLLRYLGFERAKAVIDNVPYDIVVLHLANTLLRLCMMHAVVVTTTGRDNNEKLRGDWVLNQAQNPLVNDPRAEAHNFESIRVWK